MRSPRETLFREGYRSVSGISGPLVFVQGIRDAGYGELVSLETPQGRRAGQILQVDRDTAVIQVFEGTTGLDKSATTIWLEKSVLTIPVGPGLMGKVLTGRGHLLEGGELPYCEGRMPVQGLSLNPARRKAPNAYVETGISTIDVMNTLVRGQKLPVFTGAGLPANRMAAQIAAGARVPGTGRPFLVVFAAMGITRREADFFLNAFQDSGALAKGVFFLNLAGDSAVERVLTPRIALTTAEYFAFTLGYDVLVLLTDMLSYCDALREVSAAREEIPGRRGYPGYMYSDLASLYERSGCVAGLAGSVTQIPILTMPDDDMTHPVVDLSGYITEGQIVLSRRLADRGIYPPVQVLPSLSRLMNKGIGKGRTVPEHRAMADQLYAAYAKAQDIERLRLITGDEGLSSTERAYLAFGKAFEERFIGQSEGPRTLEQSLEAAWRCLRELPGSELYRLPQDLVHAMLQDQERS